MRFIAAVTVFSLLGLMGCTKTIYEASRPAGPGDVVPHTSADTFSA